MYSVYCIYSAYSIYIVYIPQLWFYIVNPRVDALRDLANGKKENKTAFDYAKERGHTAIVEAIV